MFSNNNNTTNVNAGVNLLNSNALIQTGETTFRGTLNVIGALNVDGTTNISDDTGNIIDHPITFQELATFNGDAQFNNATTFDTTTTFNQTATFNDIIIDNGSLQGGVEGNVAGTLTGDVLTPVAGSNTVNATTINCGDINATGSINGAITGNAATSTNTSNIALNGYGNNKQYRLLMYDPSVGGPTYYPIGHDNSGSQHLEYNPSTGDVRSISFSGQFNFLNRTNNQDYYIALASQIGYNTIGTNVGATAIKFNPSTGVFTASILGSNTLQPSSGSDVTINDTSNGNTNLGDSTFTNSISQNKDPPGARVVSKAPLSLPDGASNNWTNIPLTMSGYQSITLNTAGAYVTPVTFYFYKLGGMITFQFTEIGSGTTTSAGAVTVDIGSSYPELKPMTNINWPCQNQNAGAWNVGRMYMDTNGLITFYAYSGAGTWGSGVSIQIRATSCSYLANTSQWGY